MKTGVHSMDRSQKREWFRAEPHIKKWTIEKLQLTLYFSTPQIAGPFALQYELSLRALARVWKVYDQSRIECLTMETDPFELVRKFYIDIDQDLYNKAPQVPSSPNRRWRCGNERMKFALDYQRCSWKFCSVDYNWS